MHFLYRLVIPGAFLIVLVLLVYLSIRLNKHKQYIYQFNQLIKKIKRFYETHKNNHTHRTQSQRQNSVSDQAEKANIQTFDLTKQKQLNRRLSYQKNQQNKQTSIRWGINNIKCHKNNKINNNNSNFLERRNSIDYFIEFQNLDQNHPNQFQDSGKSQQKAGLNTAYVKNTNKILQEDKIKQSSLIGSVASLPSSKDIDITKNQDEYKDKNEEGPIVVIRVSEEKQNKIMQSQMDQRQNQINLRQKSNYTLKRTSLEVSNVKSLNFNINNLSQDYADIKQNGKQRRQHLKSYTLNPAKFRQKQFQNVRQNNKKPTICSTDKDYLNLYRQQLFKSRAQLLSTNKIHSKQISSNQLSFNSFTELYHANGVKTIRDLIQQSM